MHIWFKNSHVLNLSCIMCCLNEEWRLLRVNFQEKLYFWKDELLNLLKKNPQNCPPPLKRKEKKKKKIQNTSNVV